MKGGYRLVLKMVTMPWGNEISTAGNDLRIEVEQTLAYYGRSKRMG